MSTDTAEYEEEIVYYYEGEEIDEAQILADLEAHEAAGERKSPTSHFKGDILPNDLSFGYKFVLGIVAFAMVLLPLIYLAVVGAAGYFTWLDFQVNLLPLFSKADAEGGEIILHFMVALVGALVVLFLIKPLFVRVRNDFTPITLSRTDEPELFAFVNTLCGQVGAPPPVRIDIDCQVNASAGLKSLVNNDLVLTIGLPLAAGLNMRQFAGVLAHEFGHFAQRGGMGLTQIIRIVNNWLARVVYQRDMWDYRLEQICKNWDFRIAIVVYIARLCIWLVRRVCWVLLHAGHLISCAMARQMEYDADAYEAKVAGSKVFAKTSRQFNVFGASGQIAFNEIGDSWQNGRLADNYPRYVVERSKDLPTETKDHIEFISTQRKTGFFDTHPADTDRIVAAEALGEPGVFRYEGEAAELFSDFDALCVKATRYLYEKDIGLKITDDNLVSTDETMAEARAQREEGNAVEEFIGGINPIVMPITFTVQECQPAVSKQETFDNILNAQAEIRRLAKDYRSLVEDHAEAWARWLDAHNAIYLTRARVSFKAKAFNLPKADHQSAIDARKKAKRKMDRAAEKLDEIRGWAKARFTANLQILNDDDYLAYFENGPELRAEAADLIAVLGAFNHTHELFDDIRHRFDGLNLLIGVAQEGGEVTEELNATVERVAEEVIDLVFKIDQHNSRIKYPFAHADGELTVAKFTKPKENSKHEVEKAMIEGDSILNKLPSLYFRVLGRLVVLSKQVEEIMLREMGVGGDAASDDQPSS